MRPNNFVLVTIASMMDGVLLQHLSRIGGEASLGSRVAATRQAWNSTSNYLIFTQLTTCSSPVIRKAYFLWILAHQHQGGEA